MDDPTDHQLELFEQMFNVTIGYLIWKTVSFLYPLIELYEHYLIKMEEEKSNSKK